MKMMQKEFDVLLAQQFNNTSCSESIGAFLIIDIWFIVTQIGISCLHNIYDAYRLKTDF